MEKELIDICRQKNASSNFDFSYWKEHIVSGNVNTTTAFNKCCTANNFDLALWLYSFGNVEINKTTFPFCCLHGHIQIAKWMYSLGVQQNHANGEFCEPVEQNRNSSYFVSNIDIHYNHDSAFRWSCEKGHFEIAKWLYSLGDIDVHAKNDYAFRKSCSNNHLEIAQWLYSLGRVNIHANNDEAFCESCIHGWLNVVKWLQNLCEDYEIEIKSKTCFVGYNKKDKYTQPTIIEE